MKMTSVMMPLCRHPTTLSLHQAAGTTPRIIIIIIIKRELL